jgi:cell wall-associated NlpC family hydrolase
MLTVVCIVSGCAHQTAQVESVPEESYGAAGSTEGHRARADENAAAGPNHNGATTSELMLQAMGLVGMPYKFGGRSPSTGFDCSGLVYYLFGRVFGLYLPRTAREMSDVGNAVRLHELEPGDLVFFNTLRQPFSHVGIYMGDRRFVHAPTRGGQVEVVDMTDRYWKKRYNGARRIAF